MCACPNNPSCLLWTGWCPFVYQLQIYTSTPPSPYNTCNYQRNSYVSENHWSTNWPTQLIQYMWHRKKSNWPGSTMSTSSISYINSTHPVVKLNHLNWRRIKSPWWLCTHPNVPWPKFPINWKKVNIHHGLERSTSRMWWLSPRESRYWTIHAYPPMTSSNGTANTTIQKHGPNWETHFFWAHE